MKKGLTILFSCMAWLCLSFPAFGMDVGAGKMTFEAPGDWIVRYSKEHNQISLAAPKFNYLLFIEIADNDRGLNCKEFAQRVSKRMNGTTPKRMGTDENHYFFYTPIEKDDFKDVQPSFSDKEGEKGAESFHDKISGILTINSVVAGNKVLVLAETGNPIPYRREINRIWGSIKSSDPEEQAALEAIFKE